MYINRIILITACFGVFNLSGSCSASRSTKTEQTNEVIEKKLGPNFSKEFNPSRNFVLCTQRAPELKEKIALKFLVLDVQKNTIIYENSFFPGYVKWYSDTSLEILNVPGIIQAHEDLSMYKKIVSIVSIKN
jgi:hypothetical protein